MRLRHSPQVNDARFQEGVSARLAAMGLRRSPQVNMPNGESPLAKSTRFNEAAELLEPRIPEPFNEAAATCRGLRLPLMYATHDQLTASIWPQPGPADNRGFNPVPDSGTHGGAPQPPVPDGDTVALAYSEPGAAGDRPVECWARTRGRAASFLRPGCGIRRRSTSRSHSISLSPRGFNVAAAFAAGRRDAVGLQLIIHHVTLQRGCGIHHRSTRRPLGTWSPLSTFLQRSCGAPRTATDGFQDLATPLVDVLRRSPQINARPR